MSKALTILNANNALYDINMIHGDFVALHEECVEALRNSASSIWKDPERALEALDSSLYSAGPRLTLQWIAANPDNMGALVAERRFLFFNDTSEARKAARMPYDMLCTTTMVHMQRIGDALCKLESRGY